MVTKEMLCSYVFDGCPEEDLDRLCPYWKTETFTPGQTIYCDGDPAAAVYYIAQGIVEMTRFNAEEEKSYHIGLLYPGDMFGIGEVFFEKYYISTAAKTKTALLRMSKKDFFERFLPVPCLNRFVLDSFAHIVKQRTLMVDWQSSRRKFDYFIYFLCTEYGKVAGDRIMIEKAITHETIASILNLSREHVTRLLGQLKKEGIADRVVGSISVSRKWYDDRQMDPNYATSFRRYFEAGEK